MQALDQAWVAYLRLQNSIVRRPSVDDYTNGLETALNRLIELQSDAKNSSFDACAEALTATATGRRTSNRHRHFGSEMELQAKDDFRTSIDGIAEDAIDARQKLHRIFSQSTGPNALSFMRRG